MDTLVENPAFQTYATCSAILAIKMLLSGNYTTLMRMRNKGYVNEEDARTFGGAANQIEHPAVAHALRIQRNDLENIRRNQTHLLRLLNDILSFAKLEAGVLELDVEIVEAATIIAAVEPLVRPQFAAKGVEYIMNVPIVPAAFYGDRERTIQICVNLLTNALKATEKGGRVTIAFAANERTIDFTVSDTGVGIPESKLGEIFDPFTSLARVRTGSDAGGVGLGLSISRQLARAMKGEVTAVSSVGVGSTFTLSLPRAEV